MPEIRFETPQLIAFVDLTASRRRARAFGTVVAGPFGRDGDKRYDVIGKTVNVAATLDATGVALSVAAFRKLGPALRRRFKKHTPPVTYIRLEDRRVQ